MTRGRGLNEYTGHLWIGSMRRCFDIQNTMSGLSGAYRKSSEQHFNTSRSCIRWNKYNLSPFQDWFEMQESFDEEKPCLQSLSSGLVGNELKCDNAEIVGLIFQCSLDGICIEDVAIMRNKKVKTFQGLLQTTTIGRIKVFINPAVSFSYLTALTNSRHDVAENFSFELTREPASLFKQGMVRKPTKEKLPNNLTERENTVILNVKDVCIIVGGMLRLKLYCLKSTFSDVLDQYILYLRRRYTAYNTVSCVFDGYSNDTSTKLQEHQGRTGKTSATIAVNESARVKSRREVLLLNLSNKN